MASFHQAVAVAQGAKGEGLAGAGESEGKDVDTAVYTVDGDAPARRSAGNFGTGRPAYRPSISILSLPHSQVGSEMSSGARLNSRLGSGPQCSAISSLHRLANWA